MHRCWAKITINILYVIIIKNAGNSGIFYLTKLKTLFKGKGIVFQVNSRITFFERIEGGAISIFKERNYKTKYYHLQFGAGPEKGPKQILYF